MPSTRRRQPGGPTGPSGRDRSGPGRARRERARPEQAPALARPTRSGTETPKAARAARAAKAAPAARPRLTGRAAVLVLVLAVLAVSYASSLRAYLDQRSQLDDLQATIATREGEIGALEEERTRWQDPSFVRNQARARLGYVRPGETSYVATRDGEPIEGEGQLDEPGSGTRTAPEPWYDGMWESAKVAGDPPRQSSPPADRIDGRSAAE